MASSTDKLDQVTSSNTGRAVTATLSAPGHSIAGTSIGLNVATNWPTTTKIHFSMYSTIQVGNLTVKDTSTQTDWEGILSSTTISSMVLTGGTDQAYTTGAIVEITPTSKWAKDLYDWAIVGHAQSGNHQFTALYDASNPMLETQKWVGVSSAVNELTSTNAIAGAGPKLSATGDDTNIDLNLTPKGTGAVIFPTNTIKLGQNEVTSGVTVTTSETSLASVTVTVPNGGRDLLLMAEHAFHTGSGAGDDATWYSIKESTTFLNRRRARTYATVDNIGATLFARVSAPSAGSHTYTYVAINDTRSSAVQAAATYPISLVALLI